MFTGFLPSEHGAHFQTMVYGGDAPTIAEVLSRGGLHTEVVTRHPIFDGTVPGILRGFQKRTAIFSERSPWSPLALMLAASKPRFRRQIRTTGFFHPEQRENRRFVRDFARGVLPADHLTLDYLLERMKGHRRRRESFFLFSNLYDVHAPYPPVRDSIMRPLWSLSGLSENLRVPFVMPCLGAHTYLREGFRLSEANRRMLLARYHRAIELMDRKLEDFWRSAKASGLLDDTMVILASDHGEAFGEHGLYLHDASVYDTHLHVPLWVHHPERPPETVDDAVSTRDLFGLIRGAALDEGPRETILDSGYRARRPLAPAEHFHYPHAEGMAARYRQNLAATVSGQWKVIVRREGVDLYDLEKDPEEMHAQSGSLDDFAEVCRRQGAGRRALGSALERLRRWVAGQEGRRERPRRPLGDRQAPIGVGSSNERVGTLTSILSRR
jgi:hypothetical protein